MEDNSAQENGGAFSVTGGTLEFRTPSKVTASGNRINGDQTVIGGVVRTLHKLLRRATAQMAWSCCLHSSSRPL